MMKEMKRDNETVGRVGAMSKSLLRDTIEKYISGDWGSENYTPSTPYQVKCIRGADIDTVNRNDGRKVPIRYISQSSFETKLLNNGDIVLEKSGGSPTQSTGRVAYISNDIKENLGNIVCSNFCTAFRVKSEWHSKYIFYYLQYIYNLGAFFNFEGKTTGIKNLLLEQAFSNIPIEKILLGTQKQIAHTLTLLDDKIRINCQINDNSSNFFTSHTELCVFNFSSLNNCK
ncbi:MAG: restriction endonuclease subunit S [Bacteroidales bacterium]|jgi:type I restriction enzyme S subunit|nr:restriction endonuclease subunit S [Bacteroidales bacterium]